MKLYELSDEIRLLEKMLEQDDVDPDSFMAALEGLNDERDRTIANIGLFIKEIRADVDARSELIDKLKAKNESANKRIDWLKNYILTHMDEPVKTPLVSVTKRQGSISVVVDNLDLIPDKYIKISKTVNKTELKRDADTDHEYAGFHLERGPESVVIK